MIILKWPLKSFAPEQRLYLPVDAKVVRVDVDRNEDICLWTASPSSFASGTSRGFMIIGTGVEVEGGWEYVGTARQEAEGTVFFWHVVEHVA